MKKEVPLILNHSLHFHNQDTTPLVSCYERHHTDVDLILISDFNSKKSAFLFNWKYLLILPDGQ